MGSSTVERQGREPASTAIWSEKVDHNGGPEAPESKDRIVERTANDVYFAIVGCVVLANVAEANNHQRSIFDIR